MKKRNQILAALIERGFTFRSWAFANGYEPRTVQKAVQRISQGRHVRGLKTLQILRDLEGETKLIILKQ